MKATPKGRAFPLGTLLEAGKEVAFLTKGLISERFFELFALHRERVFPQIGMSTTNGDLQERYEQGAASPEQRLTNIARFTNIGIVPSVRLDPLIPGVTDTDQELHLLFASLAALKVTAVAVSYLFLRRGIEVEGWKLRSILTNSP